MNHNDITNALNTLTPGAQWNLRGDSISGIEWTDQVQTQPTESEIIAAIAAYVPPPRLQDQLAALQTQVAALIAAQGK